MCEFVAIDFIMFNEVWITAVNLFFEHFILADKLDLLAIFYYYY